MLVTMLDLLLSPVFLTVAIGSSLLASVAGAVGSISVLKGQSLIGDALGNAAFPGVVIAFMLFETREPFILILGAAGSAFIGFLLIQKLNHKTKISLDVALAVILSSFFGLGLVLKSYISGNEAYTGASQAGLQTYIFGQASYVMERDVIALFVICSISLVILVLFYKELQLHTFDQILAESFGYKTKIMHGVIIAATLFLIAAGLKVVGAILISSMLITPCVAAQAWVKSFKKVLIVSGFIGGISAFIGVAVATYFDGLATGPCIIITMSLLCFISLLKAWVFK